jgi:hypothetical protein
MWFGEGLDFRELHLGGAPNAQGLVLKGIVPFGLNHVLDLGIERGELLVKDLDGQIFRRGENLKDAKILIESTTSQLAPGSPIFFELPNKIDVGDPVPLQFELEIKEVFQTNFWDCPTGNDDAGCDRAFHYRFGARTNADGGCEVEVCDPRLAQSQTGDTHPVQGTAVAFAGDVYDSNSFGVRGNSSGPVCTGMALTSSEQDIVNFACIGTVISKLYLLRHTWASSDADFQTTVPQRQAMLRMLTADYCGAGKSFTQNGTPIRFSAQHQPSFRKYVPEAGQSLEAVWTDQGASCIAKARLDVDYGDLESACAFVRKPVPGPCSTTEPGPGLFSEPTPSACNGLSPGNPTDPCIGAKASGNYLYSTLPDD